MARQGLDSARVVETAAVIADSEGLDAVTLARIAAELGVRAPSLYNHVNGLPGLLRGVSLLAIRELTARMRDAAVGRSGATALESIARAYRDYANEHPGRYAATVRAPERGDYELAAAATAALEVMTAILNGWGFTGDEVLHRVRIVRAALHGFVAIESGGGFAMPLDIDRSFELLLETVVAGLERR